MCDGTRVYVAKGSSTMAVYKNIAKREAMRKAIDEGKISVAGEYIVAAPDSMYLMASTFQVEWRDVPLPPPPTEKKLVIV